MAAHLHTVRQRLRERNLAPELVAKISVSLCRGGAQKPVLAVDLSVPLRKNVFLVERGYCTEFPVDQAFYDAGLDCKNAGGLAT